MVFLHYNSYNHGRYDEGRSMKLGIICTLHPSGIVSDSSVQFPGNRTLYRVPGCNYLLTASPSHWAFVKSS